MSLLFASPSIIVGVPGSWLDRAALVEAVAVQSDGLLCSGNLLMDMETGEGFSLEVYPYDPNLRRAFALAGRNMLTDEELAAVAAHKLTPYIVAPGGSPEAGRKVMRMASGLLKAGGVAVKVESSGVAHGAHNWQVLTQHVDVEALYYAFVTLIEKAGTYFSCGMHVLGKPDAVVAGILDPEEAGQLIENFLIFLLQANPEFEDGDTYSDGPDAPKFRLTHEPCTVYAKDSLFHNPYGLWRLNAQ